MSSASWLELELLFGLLLVLILLFTTVKRRSNARDHAALDQARRALENATEQEAILRAVAENANDGLVYQDMEAHIIWANPAYCRIMGWDLDEIIGRKPQEFCFPPEIKPSAEEVQAFTFDPDDITFKELHRHPNIRKNGERFWHEFSQAVVEPRPGVQRVILVSRDVTQQVMRELELERTRADLDRTAHHDALTGLANRSAFLTATDAVLRQDDPVARSVGLLYVDLNHFKAVNDSQGHAAGDALLRHVADAIRSVSRDGDLSCRMGGDEFVMACPGVTDFKTLQFIADAVLDEIRQPVEWQDTMLTCDASIGIALNDESVQTAEDLIRSADFALYEAKTPGAPGIARYDADLHARQMTEKALMEEFVAALDADQLSFAYQPVLDARTGQIRSFETLARWHRADGTVLPPDRFLGFAARLNRMADVDFAAIRATASLAAELCDRGHRIRGAFNTSSEALAHPDFIQRLEQEARDSALRPDKLVAEVLETTFFGAYTTDSVAAARISELRQRGHPVYLDDFGVGYAGLAHLGQLDITGIKLDRSLVANVVHDSSARIIVTAILSLCDDLGIQSLAEGIETAEQAEFLTLHGCYRLQGFGIARPMDRAALIEMIERGDPITIPSEGDTLRRSA